MRNSAYVTVGESADRVLAAREGRYPTGEHMLLREGVFSRVVNMLQAGYNPDSALSMWRFTLVAWLRTRTCKSIFLSEEFPGIYFLVLEALSLRRREVVMLVHNVASLRRRLPLARLGLARKLSHVLCLSPESRRILVEEYGIPADRVTVVYSRVDTAFFRPQPETPVLRQVCSAGAVNRDYATLIAALADLDVDLKIAADTVWRYSVGGSAAAVGSPDRSLPPNVEMRSWGDYLALRQLYAQSQIVIVPLAQPMLSGVTVALEGMAMGKPVILTHSRLVEGFIEDGVSGFYVDAGNPRHIRERVLYLLSHPEEAAAMGRRARERVEREFTVERHVDRILSPWHLADSPYGRHA
jgi:glycosyltransferase involved in cell wall biosynthesis